MQKYFYLAALCSLTIAMRANAQTAPSRETVMQELQQQSTTFETIPRQDVPEDQSLFVSPQEIAAARQRAATQPWAKELKERYIHIADAWINRDETFIQKIVPPWGALYVYGLGLNSDPVQHKLLKWRGWNDPLHVEAQNGTIYPNADHPDDGSGWIDSKTKEKYFFRAFANGKIMTQLTWTDIPTLADAYALTGDERYAQRGLQLLDAIATIYPRAYEGPIDYPGNVPNRKDGGRLERPYYQASRALMRFAYSYELLKNSAHAKDDSPSNPGRSMLHNIEINLLMNGADYCLRMAKGGVGASYELNNGVIDYNRSPLVVGALLGIPEWIDWALNGPLGFKYAVSNSIDINGRYYESSPSYADHTREMLRTTAEILRRMRTSQYPHGFNAYNDKRFALFALTYFTGIQTAGRMPYFGDAGPDRRILTGDNWLDKGTLVAAEQFYQYSNDPQIQESALQAAALMKTSEKIPQLKDEWELFHLPDWEKSLRAAKIDPAKVPGLMGNTLFFDYGTAILRQGEGYLQRATLLRFGPTQNHGQADELGLQFFAKGREFSFDPGYFNTHLRFGFTSSTVAHNLLVINRHNQLRQPSPGGDVQSFVNGTEMSSLQINDPTAYRDQNVDLYKRRVAQIALPADESYLIDTFWARGGQEYDYSLHGITHGTLSIAPSAKVLLREQRGGSVLSPDVDYSRDMDNNGRVKSFAKEEFYFAPPGDGYGFLSHPAFYDVKGAVNLQWSATDKTNHQMYATLFTPPQTELITAHSPEPPAGIHLEYALSHLKTSPQEIVRFSSVIMPTEGANKLGEITQLVPRDADRSTFGLRITKADATQGDDYYFAANDANTSHDFENGISFQGEEAFARLDKNGAIQSVLLAGTGHLTLPNFKMTTAPIVSKNLKVLEVQDAPVRLRVDLPIETAQKLIGGLVRLHRAGLSRPFALLVNGVAPAKNGVWLEMDASSNVESVGSVNAIAMDGNIITNSPLPRARPYVFGYDFITGKSGGAKSQELYNGVFNGLYIVNTTRQNATTIITGLGDKRTKVLLQGGAKSTFAAGDQFEIRVFASGDELEIPAWAQAKRQSDGSWKTRGTAIVSIQ